jgi:hypothetical protein
MPDPTFQYVLGAWVVVRVPGRVPCPACKGRGALTVKTCDHEGNVLYENTATCRTRTCQGGFVQGGPPDEVVGQILSRRRWEWLPEAHVHQIVPATDSPQETYCIQGDRYGGEVQAVDVVRFATADEIAADKAAQEGP